MVDEPVFFKFALNVEEFCGIKKSYRAVPTHKHFLSFFQS